jgi:hypothetical protein
MTNINLLHVLAPGCHPQGAFQITGIQAQHANLGMHCPHWNDQNINKFSTAGSLGSSGNDV